MSMLSSMSRSGLVLSFCSGLVFTGLCPKLHAMNYEAIQEKVLNFLNKKGMALVRTGLVGAAVVPAMTKLILESGTEQEVKTMTRWLNREVGTRIVKGYNPVNFAVAGSLGLIGVVQSVASFFNSNKEGLTGWAKFGFGTVLGGALSAVASVKFADQVKSVLPQSIAGFYNPIALTAAGALIGGLTQFVKNPFAKESNEHKDD